MNVAAKLIENGISPSITRIKIYEYLYGNKNHPTVNEVYIDLSKEIPTLSKTTVYNTVKLFKETGLVKMITINEEQVRIDGNPDFHGHFLCSECEKVFDFDIPKMEDTLPGGFETGNKEVYYTGLCKCCSDKKCCQTKDKKFI